MLLTAIPVQMPLQHVLILPRPPLSPCAPAAFVTLPWKDFLPVLTITNLTSLTVTPPRDVRGQEAPAGLPWDPWQGPLCPAGPAGGDAGRFGAAAGGAKAAGRAQGACWVVEGKQPLRRAWFSQLLALSAAPINSVSNPAHAAEAIRMKNNSPNKHKKEIPVSPSL